MESSLFRAESSGMIQRTDSGITFTLDAIHNESGEKTVPVRTVLDVDPEGQVIGVEIINFRHQTGCKVKRPHKRILDLESGIRFTYDPSDDLLYIRLGGEKSVQQPTVEALVTMDSQNRLLRLEVPCAPSRSPAEKSR